MSNIVNQKNSNVNWYALELNVVKALLSCDQNGLTNKEAAKRLEQYGFNHLPEKKPTPFLFVFVQQFANPLIYILITATVISLFMGKNVDAAFIGGVILLNALIGTIQESGAEINALALQKLLKAKATVVRDNEIQEIDAENLVPGDLVWIESGTKIPADMRLITANNLEIDESLLTGESAPILKDTSWKTTTTIALPDHLNMLYAGTTCTRGRGECLVVATGTKTVAGKLAVDISSAPKGKSLLILRFERFAKSITMTIISLASITAIFGILFTQNNIFNMFLFAVALSVAAIPEGLPVAITITLACASSRMAKRNVIVRRLSAVEGLGSCTLIASDKTGTLTCNELTVKKLWLAKGQEFEVTGQGYAPDGSVLLINKPTSLQSVPELPELIQVAVLCNEADLHIKNNGWIWRGDPIDIALLSLGHKIGSKREIILNLYPQIDEIPFEPQHRFAATYHKDKDSTLICVKGAPEEVFNMCVWDNPSTLENAKRRAEEFANLGYKVLALANAAVKAEIKVSVPDRPRDLNLLGLVALIDPLRSESCQAINSCRKASIKVIMITGDHPTTAFAIAKQLDLAIDPKQVVTGIELEGKTDEELLELVTKATVFARITPHQKVNIVKAAQKLGHFVAVTGDGVNDALALRTANIGVSMGKSGTDIARSASDLVITDDNFASLVAGIKEGRIAYDNIRKVTYILISTGSAEAVAVCLSLFTGLPLALQPVQLLWLNLVTDTLQALALAFDPGEKNILDTPPRSPKEGIFNRLMTERILIGASVMGFVSFGTFYWLITHGWHIDSARNILLLLLVIFQTLHVGNCRSEVNSIFSISPFKSPLLLICSMFAFLSHVCALYWPPAKNILHTEPVPLSIWITLILLASTIIIAIELHKIYWRLTHKTNS